ncbi:YgfZ/GcvT domain-containing protein [Methylobacterium nodulans]|uniref:Folate-binding protein YgfZ n=1 Tax=Methylobacterium nodulans (strain LMG 21967 / CNCM I-2342 / ORS 2060) TaxID=460265 RepID=B8IF12_METNO|nr:folate-binding protein YgfZ [Methylobacterium nodulans]ACL55723.1 folate-binding protein YgfZ [Methylobacterium nodulans ORS 2060]
MPIASLTDRAVLALTGDDAPGFLQGLITCNVETLPPDEARLGALLAPQGKILFDFLLSRAGDGFHLDAPRAVLPDLMRRLTLYRLRARVAFAQTPLRVFAAWGAEPEGSWLRDGRLPALGWRLYAPEGGEPAVDATPEAFQAHRIALGVPESGADFALGDAFPHEALMDQLGGVDFRKGCYVGQEVVSRMQHRGTARTRVVPLLYPGAAVPAGTPVTAGARALGQTGSAAGDRGLGLLRLDRLADAVAAGERVEAGGLSVRVAKPDFVTFEVPGAA